VFDAACRNSVDRTVICLLCLLSSTRVKTVLVPTDTGIQPDDCFVMRSLGLPVLLLLNGLFSRTTCVSRYQKGKTSLDLNEARADGVLGWQWHQLDHVQTVCTSLQTDNHTNTSSLNRQCRSIEGIGLPVESTIQIQTKVNGNVCVT